MGNDVVCLWVAAAVAAYFIKGLCGFANTLVFTSILSFGTVNSNISPVDLLLGYPTNLILTWKNRKSLDAKVFLPLAVLVLAGSIPGALLLKNINARAIKLIFGAIVILLGAEMLLRANHKTSSHISKPMLGIIGIAAGVLCGLFGVGALLAVYISRVTDDSGGFKANICAVFIVENTFRIVLYLVLRLITWETVRMTLILIPFVLLGLWLGIRGSRRINEQRVRSIVAGLLVLSGISLILKNI